MKNKKNWHKVLSTLLIITLLSGTISTTAAAKLNLPIPDEQISDEDVELLAKSLELFHGSGQVTEGNEIIGFNKQIFEEELQGMKNFEEVINQLEESDLFAEPTMSTNVVACDWHGMKKKPAYVKAQNKCITDGLKANYGPATVLSTIANLISDKKFTLAAKKILALGIRSNVAGVVVVLGYIMINCNTKMGKQFPGKTNCY